MPDAFIRRCLVLHLRLPDRDDELIDHFGAARRSTFRRRRPRSAAQGRRTTGPGSSHKAKQERWLPLPGQAEYLDLVRAVLGWIADPAAATRPGQGIALCAEEASGL
ncbi:MAG: hypothetical protein R3F40_07205 [Candidatus Competibacteraceae bacterium]